MFFGMSPRLVVVLFLFIFGAVALIVRLYPKLNKKDKDAIRPWIVVAVVAAIITTIIAVIIATLG